jgi:hypothetical protein
LLGTPQHVKRWFLSLTPGERHVARQICRARALNPCAGLVRMLGEDDPQAVLLASLPEDHRDGVDGLCARMNRGRRGCMTPLVVAFESERVELGGAAGEFMFRAGDPVMTDWPTAQTPWIAIDRDGDGAITTGAELFGDATPVGQGLTARNGFDALAALDDNHDGTIDRGDAAFASLLLWADRDGDRQSTPDELTALATVVVAIPLAHHRNEARCDARGNCEGERGAVRWRDASGAQRSGAVIDVYLRAR